MSHVQEEKGFPVAKENKATTKTPPKSKTIRLIKVPKFVANQWMKSQHGEVVGLYDCENDDISNVYIRKEETDDLRKLICQKNPTLNTYLLRQKTINLKTKGIIGNKSTNETDTKKRGLDNYKKKGKEYNILKGNSNMMISNTNKNKTDDEDDDECETEHTVSIVCADAIKKFDNIHSFLPVLDKEYSKILKERHYNTNVKRERATIIETRNEESIDAENSLFRFFTAEDRMNLKKEAESQRRGIQLNNNNEYNQYNSKALQKNINTNNAISLNRNAVNVSKTISKNSSASNAFNKQKSRATKKTHMFDADKAKISMFRIFEMEGNKGVPFSVFSKRFNIAPHHLKSLLDEIAVKRKRNVDKRTVYFLKDFA